MRRILAYAALALTLASPLVAQDSEEDAGGPLVRLLESTLSNDSRTIKVTGLEGALSSRATIQQIEVSDVDGVWFRLNGAVLDWNRLALVRGRFSVNELTADNIEILRKPIPETSSDLPSPEAQPFAMPELPVSIEIGQLAVGRIDLAEPVVGLSASLSVDGKLMLADGVLDADLAIDRLDRSGDQIGIRAGFSNETRHLSVDIRVAEAAGGLISKLMKLPGAPPVILTIKGEGPLDDFDADLKLATDQIERVRGRISLTGEGEDDAQSIAFDARIDGDLRPLLASDFDPFFGPQTRLQVMGRQDQDGRIDVTRIELAADALSVQGSLALSPTSQPERVNLDIALSLTGEESVVLPVAGGETRLRGLTARARFDASQSADWTLVADIDGFSRPDMNLGNAALQAAGTYVPGASEPLTGTLEVALDQLGFSDPGLRQAVGNAVTLRGDFAVNRRENLRLSKFELSGQDYDILLNAVVSGLRTGFDVEGTAQAELSDLARFSTLAGRPVAGRVSASIEGSADPLGGLFDVRLTGRGQDLRSGQDRIDALLIGQSDLSIDASRGPEGLQLRRLLLDGEALQLDATGTVRTGRADLNLSASLDDLGRVLPDLPGPVTVSGTATQRRGTWTADLNLAAPGGARMVLDATVPKDLGPDLALDFSLSEPAGGPVGRLLGIPGGPPLALDATGRGALSDFTADLALATEGLDRLTGTIKVQEQSGTDPATAVAARLSGDLTPFLAPAFHDFFGSDANLTVDARRMANGAIDLDRFEIDTGSVELSGNATLDGSGKPLTATLEGRLGTASGASKLRLPVPGIQLTLRGANLSMRLDGQSGDAWSLSATLDGLTIPQARLGRLTLRGDGAIQTDDTLIASGQVRAGLQGISMSDPALDRAIGSSLSMNGEFMLPGDDTLALPTLNLRGQDIEISADAALAGLSTGQEASGSAELRLTDLSRFSGLARRPISGKATATVGGTAALNARTFDVVLTGLLQDITTGIAQADKLLAGEYHLRADAASRGDGVDLRSLILTGPTLKARASGVVSPTVPDLSVQLKLADMSRIGPKFSGEMTVDADLSHSGNEITAEVAVDAPNGTFANASARLSPDGNADVAFDGRFNRLERFVPQLAGALEASGTASRSLNGSAGFWKFDTTATGPAGISTVISGLFDEANGALDASARGKVQMAAANIFLSPISMKGGVGFDLAIKGPPALESVSGNITLSNGAIAVPQIQNSVQNFGGTVTLKSGSAAVGLRGALRTGGSFTVNGPVTLAPPFDGNLSIDLQQLILTDDVVYRAPVSGALSFSGPLAGAANLSGRIDIGETEIDIGNVGGASSAAPIPDLVHIGEPSAVRTTRARAGLTGKRSRSGGQSAIGLDLLISAPRKIFVRGRGLDAELGGEIRVRGTTANVAPSGQIELIRGIMALFGRRLELSKGLISLQGSLRPYMEFAATSSATSGSATLEMSGELDNLEIDITSDPELPDAEALALLVFGNEFSTLSPLKLAQIASGLVTLRGGGNFVGDKGREATGADSVSLANDSSGAPSLGVGGYLSDNIYTDVAVNADGDTELNINLDVTDSLTIKGTVDNAGQSGIGIFFDRDY